MFGAEAGYVSPRYHDHGFHLRIHSCLKLNQSLIDPKWRRFSAGRESYLGETPRLSRAWPAKSRTSLPGCWRRASPPCDVSAAEPDGSASPAGNPIRLPGAPDRTWGKPQPRPPTRLAPTPAPETRSRSTVP